MTVQRCSQSDYVGISNINRAEVQVLGDRDCQLGMDEIELLNY